MVLLRAKCFVILMKTNIFSGVSKEMVGYKVDHLPEFKRWPPDRFSLYIKWWFYKLRHDNNYYSQLYHITIYTMVKQFLHAQSIKILYAFHTNDIIINSFLLFQVNLITFLHKNISSQVECHFDHIGIYVSKLLIHSISLIQIFHIFIHIKNMFDLQSVNKFWFIRMDHRTSF